MPDFEYDVFISYSRSDQRFADTLKAGLEKRGLKVFEPQEDFAPEPPSGGPVTFGGGGGAAFVDSLQKGVERSRSFLFIAAPRRSSGWQNFELDMALRQLVEDRHRTRRIIPLLRRGVMLGDIPPTLQSFQVLQTKEDRPSAELLDKLAHVLRPGA